ncbi:hypothetical protein [Novosphingobium sp. AP12]|uniref:hypothetical protein n=1 Tax=Novosphingobium sp. AP12 TaxID=1144305 RepID=UPI00138AEB95|nr:hypothetical protein [Novosphingobium sp. AP12]
MLENALAEVATDGLGLGEEEVLYVPRLSSPARLRPGLGRHFSRGITLHLGDLARSAERDPTGVGRGDRPCRFSSHAAFAAWLIGCALQQPHGQAPAIMRAVTGHATDEAWWRAEILGVGRVLVPVIARLSQVRLAAVWLTRLQPFEIEMALEAIARDYGVQLHAEAPRTDTATDVAQQGEPTSTLNRQPADCHNDAMREGHRAAERIVREDAYGHLTVPARRLLLAVTVLHQRPSVSRADLAAAVTAMLAERRKLKPPPAGEAIIQPPVAAWERISEPSARERDPHDEWRRPTPQRAARSEYTAQSAAGPEVQDGAPARVFPADPDAQPDGVESPPETARDPASKNTASDDGGVPSFSDAVFETRFGGLLFLVNAFTSMGLYPDFTRPLDPALDVPPLALADRLGVLWFGHAYRKDPLHRWIVKTASTGTLPRRWRVERDWLTPFGQGDARYDHGTLWHPAGFVLSAPIGSAVARTFARGLGLRDLARTAGGSAVRRRARPPNWVACLALFLTARFRRATAQGNLAPADLATPARCVVAGQRLDVHFPLAGLPLPLRLAGLDRDPGWLPAEGRDIRFHFE